MDRKSGTIEFDLPSQAVDQGRIGNFRQHLFGPVKIALADKTQNFVAGSSVPFGVFDSGFPGKLNIEFTVAHNHIFAPGGKKVKTPCRV